MPTLERLEAFIRAVESNRHDEVIEEFYAPDASMQENNSEPLRGRPKLIEKERNVLNKAESIHSKCIRPLFLNGNYVAIKWKFRFDWLDGTVTEMEEIAYQRWDQENISEEKFFYDPSQLNPK